MTAMKTGMMMSAGHGRALLLQYREISKKFSYIQINWYENETSWPEVTGTG